MGLVARIVVGVLCVFAIYVGVKAVKLHNRVEKCLKEYKIDNHTEKLFNQAMYYTFATFCALILACIIICH